MFGFFERLVDPYQPYQQPDTPPQRLWPFLRDYVRPFRAVFAVTGLFSVASAFSEVALIWYLGRLIDVMAASGPAQFLRDYTFELISVALAIFVLRPLIQVTGVALLHNTILPNFGTMIRWRAHRHVLRQPLTWFEGDFAGRIAARVMQTPPAAGDAVFQTFDAVAFAAVTVVGAGFMLAEADPRLLAPLVVWFTLYMWLVHWTIKRAGPASTASSDARSAVTAEVVDTYANIHSIKLFADHTAELTRAKDAIEHARTTFQAEMRILTKMDLALTLLNGALILSVIGLALGLWLEERASIGTVAAASALVLRLNNMTFWIMWAFSSLVQALGVVREGMGTIAQPLSEQDAPNAPDLQLRAGQIEIRGLSHHYGHDSGGLNGIDLVIRPGEKIGLIGRSGAGKSTLVKLLLRFYRAEKGQILIDGQDISTVTEASLRAQIGMVAQEAALLHRSVRANITLGRPDLSDAQLTLVAKRAQSLEFIENLEDPQGRRGFDAEVGERGVRLSGGQRQRIALARVIAKDAPILILDEATSALDSETESTIQAALSDVMAGKTVIAIAHRLSTLAEMDRIVVLDAGRIVEMGTPEELLAKGGLYSRFLAHQAGGFIDDMDKKPPPRSTP